MRIPTKLRQAIKTRLRTDPRPHSSRQITDSVNPEVKQSCRRTSREMAFVLKQMVRDGDLVITNETKNGLTPSGNERTRVEYILNLSVEDPDIISDESCVKCGALQSQHDLTNPNMCWGNKEASQ
jgi:hypothetical protein|tara:strand:+ start:2044 stop:2418 length:375 start_codon:yes stop_codon:yes gene_type:complete